MSINPLAKKARIPRHQRPSRRTYMQQWLADQRTDPARKAKLDRTHWSAVLKKKYGITADDYDRMLAEQRGRCAICGHPPKKRRLSVDHDHKTSRVRGLLCFQCNYHLVGRTPSVEKAMALVDYLTRNAVS